MPPPLPSCRIYSHDVAAGSNWHNNPKLEAPPGWDRRVRGPQELWAQRVLADATHPWIAPSIAQADVVLLSANFSLLCLGHKMVFGMYNLWAYLERTAPHLVQSNSTMPRAIFLETSCKIPWAHSANRKIGRVFQIRDLAAGSLHVVAPAVMPPLASARHHRRRGFARQRNNHERQQRRDESSPLLFFAGHVPKLYLAPLRYEIWRQVRDMADVTAISGTINCTVLAWAEICRSPRRLTDGESYKTFCRAACPLQPKPGREGANCARDELALRKACKGGRYARSVQLQADRFALDANGGQRGAWLSSSDYSKHVMGHRFCLAAPGDGLATPKVTEFVFAAAGGGCVPVFVVPDCHRCTAIGRLAIETDELSNRTRLQRWSRLPAPTREALSATRLAVIEAHIARMMPFSRWKLDYCELGFVLPVSVARRNMTHALAQLRSVSEETLQQKRAACAAAESVLVYRADDRPSDAEPGAVSHILSELCQLATAKAGPTAVGDRHEAEKAQTLAAADIGLRVPPIDGRCLIV